MRLSRGLPFLGSALLGCGAWLVVYASGTFDRAADQLMQREVQRGHFSGTVLISRDHRVLFAKGFGIANADWSIPNSTETKFDIGSITKTFTATLVLQLEQQRKLALTDRICTFIAPCPPAWLPVTLHHLLSHTSGIFNLTLAPDFDREHGTAQTREEILARILAQPLAFVPGSKFEYSNSNYYLLASVIEKVTGQPYESVLKQRILEPLGMRDTGVLHRGSVLSQHATGYRPVRSGVLEVDSPIDESWSFGAGSMYSTVGDLEKWSAALDSDRILPRATLERMWQPVKGEYGYGWEVPTVPLAHGNRRIVQHTGFVPGFVTVFERVVDEHLTVIVLANSLASEPKRVAQSLIALDLGEHYVPTFDRETVPITAQMQQRYVGDYELGGEIFTISARDGRLFVQDRDHPENPGLEILAASDTQLFLRDTDGDLTATQDGHGRVTGFLFSQGNLSRVVRKVR
jgi:CubicO group peptidase (beta-lactamase class C family)